MPEPDPNAKPPALIQIASLGLGPRAQCREKAWELLVDFPSWLKLVPAITGVELKHANPSGRGTVLSLQYKGSEANKERWRISHWHPGQRLELIRITARTATGLRFDLDAGQDSEHVNIGITLQLEHYGFYKLLQPLNRALKARRMRALFVPLLQHLQEQVLAR